MNLPLRTDFDLLFEQWKNSPPPPSLEVRRWECDIQNNPYLLEPEQLIAIRAADFPLAPLDAGWIDRYLELFAYAKEHGHTLVPAKHPGKLGIWACTQRGCRLAGKLSPSRQYALDRLDFCWDPKMAAWKDHLTDLTRFIEAHGHMRVPNRAPWQGLEVWIDNLRSRKESLDPKQREELNRLGFVWAPFDEAWQSGLAELKEFIREHGHANVPARGSAYPRAATMIQRQRALYRTRRLDPERKSILESLGVFWNVKDALWQERYQELSEVHRKLGHIRLPKGWTENKTLERWLRSQKERMDLLTDEQKEKLESLEVRVN